MTTTDLPDQPLSTPNVGPAPAPAPTPGEPAAPVNEPTSAGPNFAGPAQAAPSYTGPTYPGPTATATNDARPSVSPRSFRLVKSRQERRIFGVCGGIARQLDVDVTLVRVAFVVAAFAGFGIPLYLAAAVLAPFDDQAR